MVGRVRRKTVLPHIRKVWQLSERRACEILGVKRRAVRYQSVRGDVDVAVLARIKSIAAVRIRYGQRRIHARSDARVGRLLSSVLLDSIAKPD